MKDQTMIRRASHVARMRGNFALEGLYPDSDDQVMQTSYVNGTSTLADLLAYARDFAISRMAKCTAESSRHVA